MSWKEFKGGKFFVKYLYVSLAQARRGSFPANMVYNPDAPTKMSFFTQETEQGKI